MKKSVLIVFALMFNLVLTSAVCDPSVSLINQDPYPAIPGEYVKLVFQINGLSNEECKNFIFELVEKYPLVFDPDTDSRIDLDAGFYERDYSSFLIAPYKIRVDEDALEGDNPIETRYFYGNWDSEISDEFNLYVEDSRAEFELHIDKYSYATKEMTLEILNIADTDIEALTLEIPKQDNIAVSGTNRVVVGDLDSNEYTTADFKADVKEGEVSVKILYTDQTGKRRETIETIIFDSSYFIGTKESSGMGFGSYFIILLILVGGWWFFFKRKSSSRERAKRRGSAKLN